MSNKLKALGLAFVASLALSAVMASGAAAKENIHYYAEEAPTTGTASQTATNVFTTSGGEVSCTSALFTGTQSTESSTELTVTPEYTGCSAFTIANTHVKMNGCDYLFTTPSARLSVTQYTIDPPHIRNCNGNSIEITPTVPIFGTSVCTVKIAEQTPTGGHLIATNQGEGNTRDVLVNATVSGIVYTVEGGGGLCGSSGSNGSYTGPVTLRGYNDTGGGHANHNGVHKPVEITGGAI